MSAPLSESESPSFVEGGLGLLSNPWPEARRRSCNSFVNLRTLLDGSGCWKVTLARTIGDGARGAAGPLPVEPLKDGRWVLLPKRRRRLATYCSLWDSMALIMSSTFGGAELAIPARKSVRYQGNAGEANKTMIKKSRNLSSYEQAVDDKRFGSHYHSLVPHFVAWTPGLYIRR